jgi:hypothetical protein
MVTTTINTILLDFIIDFKKERRKPVFKPLWVNQVESIDTRIYNASATKIEYTIRATDAQKYIFDQMLRSHTLVPLYDDINDIYSNVWVDSVNPMWVGDWNYLRPWEIVITLIKQGSEMMTSTNLLDFIIVPMFYRLWENDCEDKLTPPWNNEGGGSGGSLDRITIGGPPSPHGSYFHYFDSFLPNWSYGWYVDCVATPIPTAGQTLYLKFKFIMADMSYYGDPKILLEFDNGSVAISFVHNGIGNHFSIESEAYGTPNGGTAGDFSDHVWYDITLEAIWNPITKKVTCKVYVNGIFMQEIGSVNPLTNPWTYLSRITFYGLGTFAYDYLRVDCIFGDSP